MGIFSKLFGKETPPPPPFELEPTAVMMDEDRYWQMITDSIDESGGDRECQENVLISSLEKLEPVNIIGFRLRTDKLLYDTYNPEMWCAGYIMNGGCSDDGFEYFRLWIIAQGRQVYENAKQNPDSLSTAIGDEIEEFYDFESLWYVALKAFENKTGKEIYNFLDEENFKFSEADYPRDFEFNWQGDDPDSMKKICPNLFAQFENVR